MRQDEAFNILKMGKNVFLTGEAGAGKTYLLNQYIHYLKENNVKVAITASTGIAATHLQGTTIHSWSGIGVRDTLTDHDLEKIITTDRIKRNYKKTKVLIIDEISMLHQHQLDMVNTIARHMLGNQQPFGGIQVVLCGDFFQLPPISANGLMQEKHFAFEANSFQQGDFHICYLHEQHRQGDDLLHVILNDIRSGTAGEKTKVPLRTRYKKEPHGTMRATKLYCRNINVDAINEKELMTLEGQEKKYSMGSVGYSATVEGLKRSCLALEELKLKIGAEVMFIKNDPLGKFVNGTRGVVVGFENNSEAWPIVKTFDNETFIAYPEEWKYEDNGIVRAIITQVPLRLAWAITIHKSQGMTLDAAEIDLGDAFEPGMGYVALSRVRSLNGLKLMNLNEMALRVHPKILEHDKTFKQDSEATVEYLKNLTEYEMAQFQKDTLIERFGGCKDKTTTSKKKTRKKKEKSVATHLVTLEMLKKKLSLDDIAKERELSISTILTHAEKLKGLQMVETTDLEHWRETLAAKDFNAIFDELNLSADGRLTPVYDKFAGMYSFASIRLVRLFINI
jgi:hypothetical protein